MRKLKFNEVMIISKILREMNIKFYVEYLMNNKIEKLLKQKGLDIEDKQKIIAVDVLTFIIQNIEQAEESVYKLFASYENKTIEQVKEMDVDESITILTNIFTNGLPTIISSIIDLNSVQKKMEEMKMEMN
jgi:hypothetical protein